MLVSRKGGLFYLSLGVCKGSTSRESPNRSLSPVTHVTTYSPDHEHAEEDALGAVHQHRQRVVAVLLVGQHCKQGKWMNSFALCKIKLVCPPGASLSTVVRRLTVDTVTSSRKAVSTKEHCIKREVRDKYSLRTDS